MMLDEEIEEAEEYTKNLEDRVHNLESELALYKSKTPHTADGKPIFIASAVWVKSNAESNSRNVIQIGNESLRNAIGVEALWGREIVWVSPAYCYNTREALEAAMEGGSE